MLHAEAMGECAMRDRLTPFAPDRLRRGYAVAICVSLVVGKHWGLAYPIMQRKLGIVRCSSISSLLNQM